MLNKHRRKICRPVGAQLAARTQAVGFFIDVAIAHLGVVLPDSGTASDI
jgi:hypothetical protein